MILFITWLAMCWLDYLGTNYLRDKFPDEVRPYMEVFSALENVAWVAALWFFGWWTIGFYLLVGIGFRLFWNVVSWALPVLKDPHFLWRQALRQGKDLSEQFDKVDMIERNLQLLDTLPSWWTLGFLSILIIAQLALSC